jgi:hypothetical protein
MENNRFKFFSEFYSTLEGIHSIMDVDFDVNNLTPVNLLNNEWFDKRYVPIYLESIYDKEIFHTDGIFKHTSGFYIYLSRFNKEPNFKIKIIYKVEKYEQIKIYINGLKKMK